MPGTTLALLHKGWSINRGVEGKSATSMQLRELKLDSQNDQESDYKGATPFHLFSKVIDECNLKLPPNIRNKVPKIRTGAKVDVIVNEDFIPTDKSSEEYKNKVLQFHDNLLTVNLQQHSEVRVTYSDGSTLQNGPTTPTGAGWTSYFVGFHGTLPSHSIPICEHGNCYIGEKEGLFNAIPTHLDREIRHLFFVDNLGLVRQVGNECAADPRVRDIQVKLNQYTPNCTVVWVPSHLELIQGNEVANDAAELGAKQAEELANVSALPALPNNCTVRECMTYIKKNIKERLPIHFSRRTSRSRT